MKKILLTILLVFISLSLLGCQSDQKTDEELEAEVLAELEAERLANLDVRDDQALYEGLKDSLLQGYDAATFDRFEKTYLDLDGDGQDEVALAAPYGEGPLEKLVFVGLGQAGFEAIQSEIPLYKYQNQVDFQDGLVGVSRTSGGSSIRYTNLSFYAYDQGTLHFTGTELVMEDIISLPDGYEIIGEIEGPWTDFQHSLTRTDLATDRTFVTEKAAYTYQPASMDFAKESQGQLLSLSMNKEDILARFGSDYEETTMVDGMYDTLETTWAYPGITFIFSSDTDQLAPDALPTFIEISSNDYYYQHEARIGDRALDAIQSAADHFDRVENRHGGPGEMVADAFFYEEINEEGQLKNTGFVLTFGYDSQEKYTDLKEIGDEVKVTSIKFLSRFN